VVKVDDDAIDALAKRYPKVKVLQMRQEHRKASDRLSKVLAIEPEGDGRVRFNYSLHRTNTGRVASGADDSEPDKLRQGTSVQGQNITDRDRRMFVAPEGMVFLAPDWSQIELRLVAWHANEVWMLEAFARGEDVHSLTAAMIYGIDPKDAKTHMVRLMGEQRPARDGGKKLNHMDNYYAHEGEIAKQLGVSKGEGLRLFTALREAKPAVTAWQEAQIEKAIEDGHLTTSFGRRVPFYRRRRKDGTWTLTDPAAAIAFQPQSEAGDMCKAVMPVLDEWDPINTKHDEFTFELWPVEREGVVRRVKAEMERNWPQLGSRLILGEQRHFTCPVDLVIGKNWGKYHPTENPDGLKDI
jgi:DNA polymerase-1